MIRAALLCLLTSASAFADTDLPDIPDVTVLRDHAEFDVDAPFPDAFRLAAIAHFDPEYLDHFPALSPITHWVTKNFFLSGERSMERVTKQLWLSIDMANEFTHDEILRLLLQEIYLGRNCFGVIAALEHRLGGDPENPTLAQGLTLMALARAPDRIDTHPDLIANGYHAMVRDGENAGLWDTETAEMLREQGPISIISDARCPFE